MSEYWYIEKPQSAEAEVFNGRGALTERIQVDNERRENNLPYSQFYGYFSTRQSAEGYVKRNLTNTKST